MMNITKPLSRLNYAARDIEGMILQNIDNIKNKQSVTINTECFNKDFNRDELIYIKLKGIDEYQKNNRCPSDVKLSFSFDINDDIVVTNDDYKEDLLNLAFTLNNSNITVEIGKVDDRVKIKINKFERFDVTKLKETRTIYVD